VRSQPWSASAHGYPGRRNSTGFFFPIKGPWFIVLRMQTEEDVFFPPGVQIKLTEVLGYVPLSASAEKSQKIHALWQLRKTASDQEIDQIDREMLAIMLSKG
jgi:hypothetical protein